MISTGTTLSNLDNTVTETEYVTIEVTEEVTGLETVTEEVTVGDETITNVVTEKETVTEGNTIKSAGETVTIKVTPTQLPTDTSLTEESPLILSPFILFIAGIGYLRRKKSAPK